MFLVSTQQTTREYLRSLKTKNNRNPYSLGNIVQNIITSLCKPRGYSFISTRASFEPGDRRFVRYPAATQFEKGTR